MFTVIIYFQGPYEVQTCIAGSFSSIEELRALLALHKTNAAYDGYDTVQ